MLKDAQCAEFFVGRKRHKSPMVIFEKDIFSLENRRCICTIISAREPS